MKLWTSRMMAVLAVLVVTCAAAMPAWAGEKEHAAALELVKKVVPKDAYEQMVAQMTSAMTEQFRGGGEKLPPDFDAKMRAVVLDVMAYEDVLAWTADIYAARFTVDELKEISKFYDTPVGKKLMKLLPELGGEVGKKIAVTLPERMPAALKKHGLLPSDDADEPTPAPPTKRK